MHAFLTAHLISCKVAVRDFLNVVLFPALSFASHTNFVCRRRLDKNESIAPRARSVLGQKEMFPSRLLFRPRSAFAESLRSPFTLLTRALAECLVDQK